MCTMNVVRLVPYSNTHPRGMATVTYKACNHFMAYREMHSNHFDDFHCIATNATVHKIDKLMTLKSTVFDLFLDDL